MKYTKGIERMGFPDFLIFGIELEADNVQTKGESGLYHGKSKHYILSKGWDMATPRQERLVAHGGAELVSPKLHDTPEDWQSILDICEHMQKYPGNRR